MSSVIQNTFIELARLGAGNATMAHLPETVDWQKLKQLAEAQGLIALTLDGLDALRNSNSLSASKVLDSMPQMMRLEWIGEVLQNYEGRFADYSKRLGELARFYNLHGFKLMVLKGYGLSMNWPNPKHRPCGDIDIYVFGDYKAADEALSKEYGITIEKGHHHHTVFEWKGYSVENHYDFVNVHYGHGNNKLEKVFKQLAMDSTHYIEIEGERVYLPSPNLHALFLLRHCLQDFASAELNLRQVLDWAFFVEKHTGEINWNWLIATIKKFKMIDFFNCLNAICVGNLGFDEKSFPHIRYDSLLKERVFGEIIEPSFAREEPKRLVPRLLFKYKRWKGNAWKQKLCYQDNRVRSFITGVWSHLLKPKTI